MIINAFPGSQKLGTGMMLCYFDYTGGSALTGTGDNQMLKLTSSGTLNLYTDMFVDLFLVGGGGSGGSSNWHDDIMVAGGGGGGGYTVTQRNVSLPAGAYTVTIGAGGNAGGDNKDGGTTQLTDGDSITFSAQGGKKAVFGDQPTGGDGGSGGASGSVEEVYYVAAGPYSGGTNGADGSGTDKGQGQGTTTKAFGEASGAAYAAGGNSGKIGESTTGSAGAANTGNGGAGGSLVMNSLGENQVEFVGGGGGNGGSGILILRVAREV